MDIDAAARLERELLRPAIRALEVGDWNNASTLFSDAQIASHRSDAAYLVVIVRTIAGAMRSQAEGDVAAAIRQYADAAALLPDWLTRQGSSGRRLALLVGRSMANGYSASDRLLSRVAAILWREQAFLDELRRLLVQHPSPRDHLIEAYVQFLFEVEFSPFAWFRPSKDGYFDPSVTPSRGDLCRRATNLRNLGKPRAGDVSESVWKDIRGHRGLRAAAQTRLAERPLTPWPDGSPWESVPARLGRQRAWEHARQWKRDLDYQQSA